MAERGKTQVDPDQTRRREEAIAWFAALRAGAMLVEQRSAYDAWRADPQNQAALDAVHEKWGELAALKEMKAPQPSLRAWPMIAAVAAVVLTASSLGVGWMLMNGARTIETAIGQQKTQSLPDGSLIAINVASRASYEMGDDRRIVHLGEGEAAFTVKPDDDRPFVVLAGDYEVRAIGTSFNVRQREGRLEVSVSEGKVSICAASGPDAGDTLVTLEAGQLLRFPLAREMNADLPRPRKVEPDQVGEWRTRVVSYEDATVAEVLEDFNRYFERKLLVKDRDLLEQRVTVRLQVEDRERAIRTLAALLDLGVRSEPEGDLLAQ